jgi:tetratricopeptide (TPR) repeat protein
MQLGRLLELARDGATVIVCSAHGFRSGRDRPKPNKQNRSDVSWHRPLGVLAMRGPAIRRDQWLWGGTVLDMCPTILRLFGLPGGEQLDGRPLQEAFDANLPPLPLGEGGDEGESLENNAPSPCSHPMGEGFEPAPATNHDDKLNVVLQALIDDGYLEPDAPRGPAATQRAVDARAFNLAQVHLHAGRVADAAELLEALVIRRPAVGRFALQLARLRLALGDRTGCRELIERMHELDVPSVYPRCLEAELYLAEGDHGTALNTLFDVEQAYPNVPGIHRQIGDIYLATRRWDEARRAFEKELVRDADDSGALFGLGRVAEAEGDHERAAEYFLQVVAISRFHPEAHFCLAHVLGKSGCTTEALAAVERSLAQRPDHREAVALMAELKCQTERTADNGCVG